MSVPKRADGPHHDLVPEQYFDKIQTVFKPHDGYFLGERVFLSSIRSTTLMNAIKNPVYSCQVWRSEEEL